MIIACVNYKFGRDNFGHLMNWLSDAVKKADIVVGPESCLQVSSDRPNTIGEARDIHAALEKVSRNGSLLVPGTMPVAIGKSMVVECPTYLNRKLNMFFKERDVTESELAKGAGLNYHRGDSSKNFVRLKDRLIAIEICADYGSQRIPDDTWLEVVVCRDQNAEIYNRGVTYERFVAVCDSFKPVSMFGKVSKSTARLIEGERDGGATYFNTDEKV